MILILGDSIAPLILLARGESRRLSINTRLLNKNYTKNSSSRFEKSDPKSIIKSDVNVIDFERMAM